MARRVHQLCERLIRKRGKVSHIFVTSLPLYMNEITRSTGTSRLGNELEIYCGADEARRGTKFTRTPLTDDYLPKYPFDITRKIWNNPSLVFQEACVKFLRRSERFLERASNNRRDVTPPPPHDEIVGGKFLFDRERERV